MAGKNKPKNLKKKELMAAKQVVKNRRKTFLEAKYKD